MAQDRGAGPAPRRGLLRTTPTSRFELALFGGRSDGTAPPPPLAAGLEPARVYFGNEFCERLLPSPREVLAATERAASAGRALSLVLPYVGPAAFRRVVALLDLVADGAPGTEVVANDWGILRRAARDDRLTPVLGRCLNRTLRDPRLPLHLGEDAPDAVRDALRGGPFASEAFSRLCARYRVSRMEIDVPPLGLAPRTFGADLPLSVYVPFGFVASGRVCAFAAGHRRRGAAPFAPGPCRLECAEVAVGLSSDPREAGTLELELRGNTVFYRHDAALEESAHAALEEMPVDRVVWQTEVPMGPCDA